MIVTQLWVFVEQNQVKQLNWLIGVGVNLFQLVQWECLNMSESLLFDGFSAEKSNQHACLSLAGSQASRDIRTPSRGDRI